jgi:hypothetical protein
MQKAAQPLPYHAEAIWNVGNVGIYTGIKLTLTGGYHVGSCTSGRSAVYHFVCDTTVPTSNPPDKLVTFGSNGADRCTYVVTWRTPAACHPQKKVDGSCYTPPDMPLPTANQLRYQQSEIVALTHFNMASFVQNGDPGE